MRMKTSVFTAAGLLLAVLCPPAYGVINWQLTSSCTSVGGTNLGNSRTCTSDGVSVTGKAYANTGNTNGGTNNALQTAYLGSYSGGWGATNADGPTADANEGIPSNTVAPEHGVDNNGRYDSVLFSLSEAMNLTQVQLGYFPDDSDITVLAYTGGASPTDLANGTTTYAALTSTLGWTLVGHYSNVSALSGDTVNLNTSSETANPNLVSSHWLVGAYNPLVGANGTTWTTGNDYVKLLALWGEEPYNGTPEPNGMALLAATFAALMWARGRGQRNDKFQVASARARRRGKS